MTKNWIKKILTFFTFVLTIFVLASCGEVIPSGNKNANSEGRYIVHFDAIAATCDSEGREEFWYDMDSREYFSDADAKNKIDGPVAIQALGHSYSVSYTWSSDNSTCTAAKACTVCGNIELSETVTATRTVDVEPTATEDGSATYVATFTTQGFEAQTKTGVIPALGDLTNYGSESEPLTVTEALAIAQAQCLSHGDYSLQQAWVRGTAKTSPVINEAYFGSFELTDGTSTLIIYSSNKSETCDELYQNDTVTIHGYLEKYSNNFEIATKTVSDDEKYQPEALNRVAGQGSVTITQSNGGTLEASAATGTNGTTFTITATPNEDFSVVNVKANGVELEANNDGTYTAKFGGSVKVTGTFKDDFSVESKVAEYDFTSSSTAGSLEVPGEGKEHAGEDMLKAFFLEHASTEGSLSNVVLETSNVSKVYEGDNTAIGNGVTGLKAGTGNAMGTFTLRTNTAITKVVITGYSWTTSDKLSLNGEEASLGGPYASAEAVEVTFLLPGVKLLEFETNKRVIIEKIELYTSSYTTRFYSEDGTTEYEDFRQVLAAGSLLDPHDEQDAPTKASDAQYTYTFAGWATEVGGEALDNLPAVSSSAKYYAVFTPHLRSYTITFINGNGEELHHEDFEYGATPVFNGETAPSKASDESYNYSFAGWATTADGEVLAALPEVNGAATYYSIFTGIEKDKYVVKWVNYDGTVLKTSAEYHIGTQCTETYDGEAPVKPQDAQYTYTFAETWTQESEENTDNIIYRANFTPTVRSYTITFYDEDGTTVLGSDEFEYGELPEFAPTTAPTKAPSYDLEQLKLYFYSWEGDFTEDLAPVTGEASYIIEYSYTTRDLAKFATGFEATDGFSTTQVYNNAEEAEFGVAPYTLYTVYGTVTTNDALAGSQAVQMRWYPTSSSSHSDIPGYVRTGFQVNDLLYITFKASSTNEFKVQLSYSVDGGANWTAAQVYELTSSAATYKYEFTNSCDITARKDVMLKFTVVLSDNLPTSGNAKVRIDDVAFYSLVLNDTEAAAKVAAKIDTLPAAADITVAHRSAVEAVEAAYNALTAEGKALVENHNKLVEVRTALDAAIEAAKRTVTLLDHDDTQLDSVIVDYDTLLTAPTDPTYAGHTFIGWSKDAGKTLWDFSNDTVTENITLKAVYTSSITEFLAAGQAGDKTTYFYVEGYVVRRYASNATSFFLVDEDGNAVLEYTSLDVITGNKVIVKGKFTTYRGLDEITDGSIHQVLSDSTELPEIASTPIELSAIEATVAAATNYVTTYNDHRFTVTGYWYNGGLVADPASTTIYLDTTLNDALYNNGTKVTVSGYIVQGSPANNSYLPIQMWAEVISAEGIKFASASASVTVGETTFVELVLVGTPTGTASYSSDATDVATVNATTGVVTGVAEGTAKITATLGEYTASYTVTVSASTTESVTLTASSLGLGNGIEWTGTTIAPVTFNTAGTGSNPAKYYTTGTGLRLYNGDSFVLTIAEGYEIVSATFTFSGSSYLFNTGTNPVTGGTYSESGTTGSLTNVTASTISIPVKQTCRLQTVVVVYQATNS